jgi:hypothetical protein
VISVVCFKWRAPKGYRSQFTAEHVNILARMVRRHYRRPHRFICVTDDAAGIDEAIGIVPLWSDFAEVPSPHGRGNPSCYRRLKMFSAEAGAWFGERFVALDLDCVVTGDLAPLFDRPQDFMIWGDTAKATPYNGSLVLMNAGARRQVWEEFDPATSPQRGLALGYVGSDQAWIGAALGPGEARFGKADGVYSYRLDVLPRRGLLPKDARLVFFHGAHDPWDADSQRLAWVREHYR